MIQFTKTTLDALRLLREKYIDSLPCAQDMYSESLISWMPSMVCYIINKDDSQIGYIILNSSNELVEFFINDDQLTQKEVIFSETIKHFDIRSAYCKSFDQVLLSCCHKFSNTSKMVGYLFQDYNPEYLVALDAEISVRLATMEDVPFLNSLENELLEEGEEINAYVKNNSVYMFTQGEKLIGCGYLFNVIPGRKHYDVGMWINQPYRRKGYGTQIISYLMLYCIDKGFIPTAGCEKDNIASRLTLEKCGFVTKYCLINFKFVE